MGSKVIAVVLLIAGAVAYVAFWVGIVGLSLFGLSYLFG